MCNRLLWSTEAVAAEHAWPTRAGRGLQARMKRLHLESGRQEYGGSFEQLLTVPPCVMSLRAGFTTHECWWPHLMEL